MLAVPQSGRDIDVLEPYSPFELVPSNHPIFERERRLLQVRHDPNDMSRDNFDAATPLAIFQFIVAALIWAFLREAVLLWLIFAYLMISVAIDLYMVVSAVNLWHHRATGEQWDVLRLTRPADDELVTMYSALSQLRVWNAFKIGATLRLSLFVIIAPILLFILPAAVLMLPGVVTSLKWFELYAHYYGLYAFACGFMIVFISEPLWSLQTVPLIGIAAAIRFRDSMAAICAGLGVTALYRFLIFSLTWSVVSLLTSTSAWVAVLSVGVVIGAFFAYSLARRLYRLLQSRLLTLAVDWLHR